MKILVVEDEVCIRSFIKEYLELEGFLCFEAKNGKEAKKLILNGLSFDAIISDNNMPGMTGVELNIFLQSINDKTPFILCSADESLIEPESRCRLKLLAFFEKPCRLEEISCLLKEIANENTSVA